MASARSGVITPPILARSSTSFARTVPPASSLHTPCAINTSESPLTLTGTPAAASAARYSARLSPGTAASSTEVVGTGEVVEVLAGVELAVDTALLNSPTPEVASAAVPDEEPHPAAVSANKTAPTATHASRDLCISPLQPRALLAAGAPTATALHRRKHLDRHRRFFRNPDELPEGDPAVTKVSGQRRATETGALASSREQQDVDTPASVHVGRHAVHDKAQTIAMERAEQCQLRLHNRALDPPRNPAAAA